jgi:hypothetical protein
MGLAWGGPYYYPWYHAWGGVAYGPRGGAIALGAGRLGRLFGQHLHELGHTATVSRVGGGYNAWTGNAWATRVGTSYKLAHRIASAGQRTAVQNVYTGNYATAGAGWRWARRGAIAGGKVTVGNAVTGDEATARRGAAYNPNTGEVTTFGSIHGEQGTIARVGEMSTRDTTATSTGARMSGWEQHTPGSGLGAGRRHRTGSDRNLGRKPECSSSIATPARARRAPSAARPCGRSTMNMSRSFRGGGGFRGGRR